MNECVCACVDGIINFVKTFEIPEECFLIYTKVLISTPYQEKYKVTDIFLCK